MYRYIEYSYSTQHTKNTNKINMEYTECAWYVEWKIWEKIMMLSIHKHTQTKKVLKHWIAGHIWGCSFILLLLAFSSSLLILLSERTKFKWNKKRLCSMLNGLLLTQFFLLAPRCVCLHFRRVYIQIHARRCNVI